MTANRTSIRRLVCAVTALWLGASVMPAVAQADYPNKPVRMLIGFPPGQAPICWAAPSRRSSACNLANSFVENKPGAAGIIATQAAMSSPCRRVHVAGEL